MNYWLVLILLGIYQMGRVTLGLAVHPYRTMREVVRTKWLLPMALTPMGLLVLLIVATRIGAVWVRLPGAWRGWVAMVLTIGAVGLCAWQGIVAYLTWRFFKAGR